MTMTRRDGPARRSARDRARGRRASGSPRRRLRRAGHLAGRLRGRDLRGLRRADRPLRAGHVRRLHHARRHLHVARADRPGAGPRPHALGPRAVDVPAGAGRLPRARAIRSGRSCRSGIGGEAHRPGRRLAVPADDRVLRRDARARDLRGCRAPRLVASAAGSRRASSAPRRRSSSSYSLWSGIKEVAAASLIALVCASLAATIGRWQSIRPTLPSCARGRGACSRSSARRERSGSCSRRSSCSRSWSPRGLRPSARIAAALAGAIALLSIPSIAIGRSFINSATGGRDHVEHGGRQPRAPAGRAAGLRHLAGDRLPRSSARRPGRPTFSSPSCSPGSSRVSCSRWRRRALGMPLYLATGAGGFILVLALDRVGLGSPWLNGKAMAEASPALVGAGVAGAAALFETRAPDRGLGDRRRDRRSACCGRTACRTRTRGSRRAGRMAELQSIGHRFAGQGPALMTDVEPYGVRHFLRNLDPEGASDRRRRLIPLLDGQGLAKGTYADLDQFQLGGILVYRTLVLARSPSESRPPSIYRLVRRGRCYDVWQRPDPAPDDPRPPSARRRRPAGRGSAVLRGDAPGRAGRAERPPGRAAARSRGRGRARRRIAPGGLAERRRRAPDSDERRRDREAGHASRIRHATACGSAVRSGIGCACTSTGGSSPTHATG